MEPPPGSCSSPPGPRPVPPPRKGSMERRPLSPLRRGAEYLGATGDGRARGSKPGTPEKATVTQRVLIVMQSHGSPQHSAEPHRRASSPAEPDRGASSPAEPDRGASSPAEPDRGASSPAEPGRGASSPAEPHRRASSSPAEPDRGASSPAEPDRGASSPAKPAHGASSSVEPGRGASSPAEPGCEASSPAEPGRGASSPVVPGCEAYALQYTLASNWGASMSVRTSKEVQETSSSESIPIISVSELPPRGAAPPPSTTGQDRGTALPPSAPGQDRGTAPPPSTPGQDRGTAPPPSTPGQDRGTAPPPSAPGQDRGTAPPPSTPGQDRGTAPPPSSPGQDQGTAPPPSAPGQDRGSAGPPSAPGQDRGVSQPPSAPGQDRGTAPPPSTPGQNQGAAQPPSAPGQDRGAAPPPSSPGQDRGTAPPPSAPGQDRGTAPPPSSPGQDRAAAPPPSSLGQDRAAAPPPSSPGQDRAAAPPPSSPGQDRAAAPPPSSPGQDRAAAPPPSSPGQDRAAAPPQSVPGQDRAAAPPPSAPRQVEPTQDTMISLGKSIQTPMQGTPKENHRVQLSDTMMQDRVVSSPSIQSQLIAPQHSAEEKIESRGMSPPADMLRQGSIALPNYTGARDCTTTYGEGTALQPAMEIKGDVSLTDGASQSAIPHPQNHTPAARAEDPRSAPAARAEDPRSAPAARAEDPRSAPAARAEDPRSAPAARAEDPRSAPAARAEDPRSVTIISLNLIKQEAEHRQDGGLAMGHLNSTSQMSNLPAQPSLGRSSLSPIRVPGPSSPHRSISTKPPLPIPPRSNLYPGHQAREQESSASHDTASLSSFRSKAPAPDTLSYLDSVSLMSGTMESLTLLDDASSLGSDSEINGMPYKKTDKYGFLGGNQYTGNGDTAIPVEIARQRELKWLDMFSTWDKWLTRRFQKVKLRCRKGIPSSLRAKAWQYLSNSHDLLTKNPGKFEEMERQQGDPKWLDVIEKDLHRQFPFHEMFAARGGHGQQDLYRILKAYTIYRPEEGYCQAQAPVAAVLLMHMPAEQAFWCLVQICDKYLPGYYSAGLEAIQLDGEIFFALLRRICPMAYRHLKKFKIDPILYMTEWFMCIFSRTLPWSSVLRVWDMFFCEGVKIVFRVGLVLLRHTLGSVDKLRSCQGMYETMEKLRSLPVYCMQEEVLLPEVSSLPVTDSLIERESNTQLRKWRENRGELQYRPSRRLHGAKQIYEEKMRLNPTLSGSRLSLSSIRRPSPPTTPALAVQPESLVVSEGLRPALPSPTSNKAPLGPPNEVTKKGKEKQKEQEKKRGKEEREQEKRREKEEREERRKEKEREKQKEKEEKRAQKEREKAESRPRKERKFSFRRKESSSAADSPRNSGSGATESNAAHDTYF
ncbi:TBC1 domain family member 10B [Anomaloglossus baeobatrachus]|uniref:TBC1 domain family member 10B n=1 Tax=Anomaloglossus baeobatrachus TaxID=238106 RepID=UPI003F4FCB30